MRDMYLTEPASFDDILATLADLENRINHTGSGYGRVWHHFMPVCLCQVTPGPFVNGWYFETPTYSVLPSRRDNPIKAQGGDKASFTSLGAALGCEAIPFHSLSFNPSPKGTALIPGVSFVQFQTVRGDN